MIPEISGANPEDSGDVRAGDAAAVRDTGIWEPQRSLAARMLWYVVPVALVPAAVYWIIADRIGAHQRESLLQTLILEARQHEARTLSEDAAERIRSIGNEAGEVVAIVRRSAEEARRALEAGPDAKLPAEALVDEPDVSVLAPGAPAWLDRAPCDP